MVNAAKEVCLHLNFCKNVTKHKMLIYVSQVQTMH